MKSPIRGSLNDYFTVSRVSKSFRQAIPRRVEAIRPMYNIDNSDVQWMKTRAYQQQGLSDYDPCWTGEMAKRPIPFISLDPKPKRTAELFRKHIHHVLAFLAPQILPAVQAINKISALGYPISSNPGTGVNDDGIKTHQSKFDVVLELFQLMQAGDFDMYADGYHTIGVRKQNEPPSKQREFQFITADGDIYQQIVAAEQRIIQVPGVGEMVGSRTRTIVRPPVVNLYLQCWDTLLHNAILKHPLFDSNVYNRITWPDDARFTTFDCKHYERYLGMCAIEYATAIGGLYGQQLLQLIYYPFIVPSDNWRAFYMVTPHYTEGVYPQFSSGLSPVAPLGKLTNICVQVEYFITIKGMQPRDAISAVFSGVTAGLRRWSYGDDNRLMGEKAEIDLFVKFISDYLDIELDEQPRYLGTIYRQDIRRWVLPRDTYLLKLYQPERDWEFKEWPNLGQVERRAVFTEYGEPEIGRDIIPYEDQLRDASGHPFISVATAAVTERIKSQRAGQRLDSYLITDKDYLMTEQQKIESGLYWHFTPDTVATIVLQIVGPKVKEMLTFVNTPFTRIPLPARLPPAVGDNTNDEEIDID